MAGKFEVLIVGTGHAGAQAAVMLRQAGFVGSIALFGEEQDPPYERPPLSKDYLAGAKNFERILIRPETFWADKLIDLKRDHRVVRVDPAAHIVETADGATFSYGTLIWAAGGSPRRLSCSGHDLLGVHSVRSRSDVDAIMVELPATERVVVVGGGYIGLEAAAVLTKLGKQVTVLEALPRVLARVAGEPLSRFYEDEHRAHGVDVRLGANVARIDQDGPRATGVRLNSGEVLPAQMVIVGIGIVPAVQPLLDAGAAGSNGVDVDGQCRTSLSHVFAIGDCAAHENAFAEGARLRLESVQNANDQAAVAARVITGTPTSYRAVPWFWSNQYDLRLQTVGLSIGHDDMIVRGDIRSRSFSVVYLRRGRVIALDCVNATKDYVAGRRLVETGMTACPRHIADTSLPLKDIV